MPIQDSSREKLYEYVYDVTPEKNIFSSEREVKLEENRLTAEALNLKYYCKYRINIIPTY